MQIFPRDIFFHSVCPGKQTFQQGMWKPKQQVAQFNTFPYLFLQGKTCCLEIGPPRILDAMKLIYQYILPILVGL